ncbi:MAG TPA: hypothetical protein VGP33_14385 [Chloroflexota bacterium]|jgi:hypothetical protein|nr:hypothetical protein [Chloroflexota bacterium]
MLTALSSTRRYSIDDLADFLDDGGTIVYEEGKFCLVTADEVLDGGDVLPGLQLRMRDLLQAMTDDPAE